MWLCCCKELHTLLLEMHCNSGIMSHLLLNVFSSIRRAISTYPILTEVIFHKSYYVFIMAYIIRHNVNLNLSPNLSLNIK